MKLHNILYVEDEPDIQAVAKLALDVIAKPFDPMTRATQVRAVWEKRHG